MTSDDIIKGILLREGGYVDHAADRGGPTNFGITLATLSQWRGVPVVADDVKLLKREEAEAIYRKLYIEDPGFERVKDDDLRALLVDCGVNHGTHRALILLQRALCVKDDGLWGEQTDKALALSDPRETFKRLCAARVRFYGAIVSKDPELEKARAAGFKLQAVFAAGWANRVAEFIEAG